MKEAQTRISSREVSPMRKKATIKVNLVPESAEMSNSQIEREIQKDASIPWVSEIEKVTVVEQKK
jgi:hypothetical protein